MPGNGAMPHKGYAAYRRVGLETATGPQLLLALYDGAVRFMGRAKAGLEKNELELVNENIGKTQAIIMELYATLDVERGSMQKELRDLYVYLYQGLMEANMRKDGAKLAEVDGIVRQLREGWRGAVQQVAEQSAAASMDSTSV